MMFATLLVADIVVPNREGYFIGDGKRECTNCGTIYKETSKTVTLCNSCNSDRVKGESPETRMYRRAKARATKFYQQFNIDKDDIVIPEFCPILKIPLRVHKGKSGGRPDSPALDRIDNRKGYIKGNVWVISNKANIMKNNASPEELFLFGQWAYKEFSTIEVLDIG